MAQKINLAARTSQIKIINLVEKLDGNIILDKSFYIKYCNVLEQFERVNKELESLIQTGDQSI
jgi:hypothetical protein